MKDKVAIVGGGKGGFSLLKTFLEMGELEISCVFDLDKNAPAMKLARDNGIPTSCDTGFDLIADNKDIDLILEVTGSSKVFEKILAVKHHNSKLIGAKGNRIIFSLLESQQQAQAELKEHKKQLEKTIEDRTREIQDANEQLQKSIKEQQALNKQLKSINNEKTSYLLNSTHQLKAPFAAIQSYMDLITDGYTGEVSEKTLLVAKKVQRRCAFLSRSIKQMLKMTNLKSFIEENNKRSSCDINQMISRLIKGTYDDIAEQKNISIKITTDENTPKTNANRDQLIMMFSALLDNAISYSHNNSEIEIDSSTADNEVVVRIKDHGIGIRKSALKHVFKEFYRTNEATEMNPDSTGLGLSIARKIAEINNARIELESTENEGTTAVVTMQLL